MDNRQNALETKYLPVRDGETDSESDEFLPTEKYSGSEINTSRRRLSRCLPWIFHLFLILFYTTVMMNLPRKDIIRDGFDAPTDAPIEYETVRFFDGTKDSSEYFGPSNPKTDEAWEELLTNGPGIVWIDEEAASKLSEKTERVRDYNRKINPAVPGYMGNIEVFHQMHCLNRIRKLFYNQTREDVYDEIPEMREPHTMHCFEYLRMVLQCHGDVGIMSLGWDAVGEAYTAIFDTKKQCRKFDLIKDWTKRHQVLTFLPTNTLNASDFQVG